MYTAKGWSSQPGSFRFGEGSLFLYFQAYGKSGRQTTYGRPPPSSASCRMKPTMVAEARMNFLSLIKGGEKIITGEGTHRMPARCVQGRGVHPEASFWRLLLRWKAATLTDGSAHWPGCAPLGRGCLTETLGQNLRETYYARTNTGRHGCGCRYFMANEIKPS